MTVIFYGYRFGIFFFCLGFVAVWSWCWVWVFWGGGWEGGGCLAPREVEQSHLSDIVQTISDFMIFVPFCLSLLKAKANGSYSSPAVKKVTMSFPGLLHQIADKLLQTPTRQTSFWISPSFTQESTGRV